MSTLTPSARSLGLCSLYQVPADQEGYAVARYSMKFPLSTLFIRVLFVLLYRLFSNIFQPQKISVNVSILGWLLQRIYQEI